MRVEKNVVLKNISYIKIGGIAKELIYIEDCSELKTLKDKNIFVLGNCSNILFSDNFIDKSFISLEKINEIKELDKGIFEIGAGLKFSNFISFLNKNNFGGLEEIAGIPGSVGGLTVINAGAYGKEIFENILEVEYIDAEFNINRKLKKDIEYMYRNTEFKKNKNIITKVVFETKPGYDIVKVLELLTKRRDKQPLEYPNIGSIFKNPLNDYAARLIEETGLKGLTKGDAQISKKHANFIVNIGNAKYKDVIELIEICKEQVYDKFKVQLEEEIIIVK